MHSTISTVIGISPGAGHCRPDSGLPAPEPPHYDCGYGAIPPRCRIPYNCGAICLGQGIRDILCKFTLDETTFSRLSLGSLETPAGRSARDLESRRLVPV